MTRRQRTLAGCTVAPGEGLMRGARRGAIWTSSSETRHRRLGWIKGSSIGAWLLRLTITLRWCAGIWLKLSLSWKRWTLRRAPRGLTRMRLGARANAGLRRRSPDETRFVRLATLRARAPGGL